MSPGNEETLNPSNRADEKGENILRILVAAVSFTNFTNKPGYRCNLDDSYECLVRAGMLM